MEQADFHTHTTCSDGLLTPTELILRASSHGVETLSITDHDTLEAYTEGIFDQAEAAGLKLIPGVEISTIDPAGIKAHIIGLGVDPANELLLANLANQNLARSSYTEKVIDLLAEANWRIDSRSLYNAETTITKAHIARSVIEQPSNRKRLERIFGTQPTVGAFIETYLLKGQEFYVKSDGMMTPEQAVEVIHFAGGLACYAHPVATLFEAEVDFEGLENLILKSKVDAIEAEYIYFSKRLKDKQIDMRSEFKSLANKHNLLVAGGSDFHGSTSLYGNYVDLGFSNQSDLIQTDAKTALMPLVLELDRLRKS